MTKRRIICGLLAIIIIPIGIASRKYGYLLPAILTNNLGDILWATMIYFGFAAIFPKNPISRIITISIILSFAIEFSQIYHAPWIDKIRHTFLGHMALGEGFHWGDLFSYTIGIFVGAGLDRWFILKQNSNKK